MNRKLFTLIVLLATGYSAFAQSSDPSFDTTLTWIADFLNSKSPKDFDWDTKFTELTINVRAETDEAELIVNWEDYGSSELSRISFRNFEPTKVDVILDEEGVHTRIKVIFDQDILVKREAYQHRKSDHANVNLY